MAKRGDNTNHGQRMLIETKDSLAAISAATGASRSTAHQWRSAIAVPNKQMREALRDHYGIPCDAWDYPCDDIPEIGLGKRGRPKKNRELSWEELQAKEQAAAKLDEARKAKATTLRAPTSPAKPRATGGRGSGTHNTDAPYEAPEMPEYPQAPDNATTLDNARHSLACIRHDLDHRPMTATARSKARADEMRAVALIAKLEREEQLAEDRYVREHPAWQTLRNAIVDALEPYPDALEAVMEAIGPED